MRAALRDNPYLSPSRCSIVLPYVKEAAMEDVLEHSFRDYHVKGFDYICLRRSPKETVKLYFFDGDVSKMPEVVNPHDHRYDFTTLCVAGQVQNTWFHPDVQGEVFQQFDYATPLLGGKGFKWAGETRMSAYRKVPTVAGRRYFMNHEEIHTIRLMENETVLCLVQYEDRVADEPTKTFTRDREPPNLDGLYSRFTADQIISRIARLRERVPGLRIPEIV